MSHSHSQYLPACYLHLPARRYAELEKQVEQRVESYMKLARRKHKDQHSVDQRLKVGRVWGRVGTCCDSLLRIVANSAEMVLAGFLVSDSSLSSVSQALEAAARAAWAAALPVVSSHLCAAHQCDPVLQPLRLQSVHTPPIFHCINCILLPSFNATLFNSCHLSMHLFPIML
jgi:hypothetical protein